MQRNNQKITGTYFEILGFFQFNQECIIFVVPRFVKKTTIGQLTIFQNHNLTKILKNTCGLSNFNLLNQVIVLNYLVAFLISVF
jgi:hypothetical protein